MRSFAGTMTMTPWTGECDKGGLLALGHKKIPNQTPKGWSVVSAHRHLGSWGLADTGSAVPVRVPPSLLPVVTVCFTLQTKL